MATGFVYNRIPVDHYEVLGIAPDSTYEEIKKRYRELILKFHPDKADLNDCWEPYLEIYESWKVLRDPISKKAFDDSLRQVELEDQMLLYGDYKLTDMDYNEVTDVYSQICKCGDVYRISGSDIKKVKACLICCESCSLTIGVNC